MKYYYRKFSNNREVQDFLNQEMRTRGVKIISITGSTVWWSAVEGDPWSEKYSDN